VGLRVRRVPEQDDESCSLSQPEEITNRAIALYRRPDHPFLSACKVSVVASPLWRPGTVDVYVTQNKPHSHIVDSLREAPVNFFGGSPLNRLSWLRTSEPFLNAIVDHPSTRWIVLKDGNPLLSTPEGSKKGKVARLSTPEVRSLLGAKPYFAQTLEEGEVADPAVTALEAARIRGPGIVFLGLHEIDDASVGALPSSDFGKKEAAAVAAKIKGEPYFSLDVTGLEQQHIDDVLKETEASKAGEKLSFVDTRAAMSSMDDFTGAIMAETRALVDWNSRNKVRVHSQQQGFQHQPLYSFVPHVDHPSILRGLAGSSPVQHCCPGLISQGDRHVQPRKSLRRFLLSHSIDFLIVVRDCTINRTQGPTLSLLWQ
jgi:NADH pyrophosphatase NudC (nudix superfamily)